MPDTLDPLNVLREAIRTNKPITYSSPSGSTHSLADATSILLGQTAFPKDTPTRLRRPDSTATDPNAFFRLDAVLLAWSLRNASVGEYMGRVRESKLLGAFVSNTDRKGVAEYLDGKTDTYRGLVPLESDSHTPPGTPPSQGAALPKAGGTPGVGAGAGAGTASAAVTGILSTSPAKRRPAAFDANDADVVKKIKANEIELVDRTSVLRGTKLNDFTNVRTMYAERLKKIKEAAKSGTAPLPAFVPKIDPKLQARKARNLLPIIMISSSPTSLITMYNVRKFLQEAVFEDPTTARARAAEEGNTRADDVIPIYRTHTNIDPSGQERRTQSRYYVVDGVDALAKFNVTSAGGVGGVGGGAGGGAGAGGDAWDRVVCVLTTGQAWQFKPYKWTEPMTLFHHVKGFYVCWANDPPNDKIKNWNVSELKIDQHRRHVDKSVVANFWKTLDAWTLANKPWLIKS